ncbi:hypothetical protein EUGRSUZ_E00500 [Eucalyptus grandis]|uniref:Uncharacterized protein n=2 Tax=Eucalyptus grandis TaxID=71139 RepID=A0ACC3KRM7_EUCGR|nr:hypothetical protein EUGRSUZ_E00500 [Eucalyptus grandis]
MGTDFMVGDDKGWTLNFDYQAWAEGKQFYVGDNLVFKYPEGAHDVLKVNGTGFQHCVAPAGTVALATGNDVVPLLMPGKKWYICGIGNHCATGNMKLVITVLPNTEAPAPAKTSAARGSILFCRDPTVANARRTDLRKFLVDESGEDEMEERNE